MLFIILPVVSGTNISVPLSPTYVGTPFCTLPPLALSFVGFGFLIVDNLLVPSNPNAALIISLTIAICINIAIIWLTIFLAKFLKLCKALSPAINESTKSVVKACDELITACLISPLTVVTSLIPSLTSCKNVGKSEPNKFSIIASLSASAPPRIGPNCNCSANWAFTDLLIISFNLAKSLSIKSAIVCLDLATCCCNFSNNLKSLLSSAVNPSLKSAVVLSNFSSSSSNASISVLPPLTDLLKSSKVFMFPPKASFNKSK